MIADRGREAGPPVSEIVVNPRAGQGHAHDAARGLETELRRRGHDTRVRTFSSAADASHWARTCAGTFRYLFCVGGDGTLSRTATAAVRHRVPVVPVPFGFGNLCARAFRYSPDPMDAVRLLEGGVARWVDVGQGPDGLVLSHRSFGVLESIQEAVETSTARPASRLRRALAYARTAIGAGRAVRRPDIRVDVDAEPICAAAAIVTVANVPTYRGVLELTPDASPADGLLDVAIVESMRALPLFATLVLDPAFVATRAIAGSLEPLAWAAFLTRNLVPVTLGNVIGGGVLVAAVYWFVYLREPLPAPPSDVPCAFPGGHVHADPARH